MVSNNSIFASTKFLESPSDKSLLYETMKTPHKEIHELVRTAKRNEIPTPNKIVLFIQKIWHRIQMFFSRSYEEKFTVAAKKIETYRSNIEAQKAQEAANLVLQPEPISSVEQEPPTPISPPPESPPLSQPAPSPILQPEPPPITYHEPETPPIPPQPETPPQPPVPPEAVSSPLPPVELPTETTEADPPNAMNEEKPKPTPETATPPPEPVDLVDAPTPVLSQKEQMLQTIETRSCPPMQAAWTALLSQSDEAVEAWHCEDNGNFTFTLKHPLNIWVPPCTDEDPKSGMVFLFQKQTKGQLAENKISFSEGIEIYLNYPITSFWNQLVTVELKSIAIQSETASISANKIGLNFTEDKPLSTLIEKWGQNEVVQGNHEDFLSNKIKN